MWVYGYGQRLIDVFREQDGGSWIDFLSIKVCGTIICSSAKHYQNDVFSLVNKLVLSQLNNEWFLVFFFLCKTMSP